MSTTKDFLFGALLMMFLSGPLVAEPLRPTFFGGGGNKAGARVVQVIPPKKGVYASKMTLDFTVIFNKPVYVVGAPSLPVGMGSPLREGKYVSGSGSRILRFQVTPKPGDKAREGVRLINALFSDGENIIFDKSGLPADVTLPSRTLGGILVDDALPPVDTCQYVTKINGQTPPLMATSSMKSEVANDRVMQTGDGYGKRAVTIKSTRAAGTRTPIHEHEYGGVTTLVQGEMTLYMEGHEPVRAVAGMSYYMPAGHVMSGVNTGREMAIMYDSYVVPVYAKYYRPVEPGFINCEP